MKKLTLKKAPIERTAKEMWVYLLGYFTDNEFMPTLKEIADHFSTEGRHYTTEWARYVLAVLVRQKRIKIVKYKNRGIRLI